jgi:hypothetical protein
MQSVAIGKSVGGVTTGKGRRSKLLSGPSLLS